MLHNILISFVISLLCASTYPLYAATQQPGPLAHSSKDPWMQRVLHSNAHCLNIAPIMDAIYAYMQPATKGSVFVVDAHGKETEQPIATVQTAWNQWQISQSTLYTLLASLPTHTSMMTYQACTVFGKPVLHPPLMARSCPTTTWKAWSLTLRYVAGAHNQWLMWTPRITDTYNVSIVPAQLVWTDSQGLRGKQPALRILKNNNQGTGTQTKSLQFYILPTCDQYPPYSSQLL